MPGFEAIEGVKIPMKKMNVHVTSLRASPVCFEDFSLSAPDEQFIHEVIEQIEKNVPSGTSILLSLSKLEGYYSGNLKINSLNIFSHGKEKSIKALFSKLLSSIQEQLAKNIIQLYIP